MLTFDLSSQQALEYFAQNEILSDGDLAVIVGVLARDGYSNRRIREALGIERNYTVTHLKRVGTSLSSEELELWQRNPDTLTLGHMRAVANLPRRIREPLLRTILAKHLSVREVERRSRGEAETVDVDTHRFAELMSESIGRPVSIQHNKSKQSGKLVLSYHSNEDLDRLARTLGFQPDSI